MGKMEEEEYTLSITAVRAYLAPFSLAQAVLEFPVSSATVELAAQALGTAPARIAKSLSFLTKEGPVLLVTAGDAKVDNTKYKALFHEKARMVPFDEVEAVIGHAAGGVCPFAVRSEVRVYLDCALQRFETVYPACGSANSAIALSPTRLAEVSQNFQGWVDVCKAWQK